MLDFRQLVAQALSGGRRNMWKSFHYPTVVGVDQYWLRYKRDGIAARIVRAYPDACWNGNPIVQDERGSSPKEDQDDFSPFTAAWEELNARLKVLSYLQRTDRLSRVGHFSILVLGFAGGGDLSDPQEGQADLIYLAPYSEKSVKVDQWEDDTSNERFGLPRVYQITPSKVEQGLSRKGKTTPFKVHWTRVIHVAENCDEDDVFGEPALRPVWNYLLDLEKVVGSGAETFWLNARGGLSIEAAPDAKFSADTLKDMKKQAEDYEQELRRILALQGAKVNTITQTVADPKPNSEVLLQLIGGTTGIPQRILTGSERGELASTEDANSWESRVDERRRDHCGPNILQPFVERMIATGNLPEPEGVWFVQWPEASAMSPEKQADIAVKRITAASTWANGMADRVIAKEELRTMIGLTPESEYDLEEEPEDADDLDSDPPEADPEGGREGEEDNQDPPTDPPEDDEE